MCNDQGSLAAGHYKLMLVSYLFLNCSLVQSHSGPIAGGRLLAVLSSEVSCLAFSFRMTA